jgi:cell division septation protein DedD
MSKNTNTTTPSNDDQEFNLKHRVTGAAVLLFFGALVIPWLLGPPSAASKQGVSEVAGDEATLATAKEIERVLLGPDAQKAEVPEETVYISKITPLDNSDNSAQKESPSEDAKTSEVGDEKKPAEQNTSKPSKEVKEKAPQVAKNSQEKTPVAKEEKTKPAPAKDPEVDEQKAREQALLAALDAEDKTKPVQKVSVGWIVQVGLFIEKTGAQAQIDALKQKGFTAQTTVVDTNRGPKTGTRVWIGPFEKRTEAESQNQQLRSKMGKAGFIRVYP